MFSVYYTPKAIKALRKLDRPTRALLLSWIEKNLVGCSDPRTHGRALSAESSGLWRYRIGYYRLIAEISDATITILMLNVGHREDIYEALGSRG